MAGETSGYLSELLEEKKTLDQSLVHCSLLLAQEIDRVQTGSNKDKMIDVNVDKPIHITTKIRIPNKEYQKINFVGRILGPKGNNMKRLTEETGAKISVQGRGSMKDKSKEEELRKEGGKYAHLSEELHVLIETFGEPEKCYQQMAHTIQEIKKLLSPDYMDDESGLLYPVNGANRLGVNPAVPPMPQAGRGRGPELRPPSCMMPAPPMARHRFPPGGPLGHPGMGPPPIRRGVMPPLRGPRPAGMRPKQPAPPHSVGLTKAPGYAYGVQPRPFAQREVAPESGEPSLFDYNHQTEYELPAFASSAVEDFTTDEWAKDIAMTDNSYRGKAPASHFTRGHFSHQAHPYGGRGAN